MPTPVDPAIRYHAKVDKRGPDDCWPWTAARFEKGYGAFRLGKKQLKAHRFGYALLVAPIPPGLYVCHTCDNPPCQNPAHWFLGTHKDNAADRENKKRGNHLSGDDTPWSTLTAASAAQIREMYADGVLQREIAETFHIQQSAVSQIVLGKRWTSAAGPVTTPRRQSGLTEEDVRTIRILYCEGFSQQKIADRYDTHQTAISAIIRRKTWSHVV